MRPLTLRHRCRREKWSHILPPTPVMAPPESYPCTIYVIPGSTLTLGIFNFTLRSFKKLRRTPTSLPTLSQTISHLCSWAGCHSMSHRTGKTSVESPPAPEGAGRRRRRMTCRRSLGPLSCPGLGRQDLRRTQLGRRREKGRSEMLSRALSVTLGWLSSKCQLDSANRGSLESIVTVPSHTCCSVHPLLPIFKMLVNNHPRNEATL